jgi:hypothetical protein
LSPPAHPPAFWCGCFKDIKTSPAGASASKTAANWAQTVRASGTYDARYAEEERRFHASCGSRRRAMLTRQVQMRSMVVLNVGFGRRRASAACHAPLLSALLAQALLNCLEWPALFVTHLVRLPHTPCAYQCGRARGLGNKAEQARRAACTSSYNKRCYSNGNGAIHTRCRCGRRGEGGGWRRRGQTGENFEAWPRTSSAWPRTMVTRTVTRTTVTVTTATRTTAPRTTAPRTMAPRTTVPRISATTALRTTAMGLSLIHI